MVRLAICGIWLLIGLSAGALEIQTKYGTVRGAETGAVATFKGIPYAAPPVGPLRWAAPVEPQVWSGVRQAQNFSSRCAQMSMAKKSTFVGSEDCLYLNIFRPKKISGALPVMVFIHGGGNTVGSSSDELFGETAYDGSKLASEGVIVVTFNYRLGVFGFLAHPGLKATDGSEGNFAFLDQIQVLKFVKENIAAFGGDPANVTLFGESAGAIDTLVLLASPRAQGLFQKAIVESGFLNEMNLSDAEKQGATFAQSVGCSSGDSASCLRAISTTDALSAALKLSNASLATAGATIDGVILKQGVLQTIASGQAMHIPVIIGTNADEMRTLLSAIVTLDPIFSAEDYHRLLETHYGADLGAKIEAQYPAANYATPRLALEEMLGDQLTHCPTRALTRALLPFQASTYRYVFSHVGADPTLAPLGAGHGLELPYVFGTLAPTLFTASEFQLSAEIRHSWISFAKTGHPDSDPRAPWENALADRYLNLDLVSKMQSGFHGSKCDFWDQIH